jgi:hypothetical protein
VVGRGGRRRKTIEHCQLVTVRTDGGLVIMSWWTLWWCLEASYLIQLVGRPEVVLMVHLVLGCYSSFEEFLLFVPS